MEASYFQKQEKILWPIFFWAISCDISAPDYNASDLRFSLGRVVSILVVEDCKL